jgi:hypothetical protein
LTNVINVLKIAANVQIFAEVKGDAVNASSVGDAAAAGMDGNVRGYKYAAAGRDDCEALVGCGGLENIVD